jgi:hypothetical protein
VGEVEQVPPFGVVELQGASDRIEDGCGYPSESTTFQF